MLASWAGMSFFKVGVRYCGGCNPTFERVGAVESLFRELRGKAQAVGYREDGIQALLLVCGCPTACPAEEGIPSGLPSFLLRAEEELASASMWIKSLL